MPVVSIGGKDVTLPSLIIVGGQVRANLLTYCEASGTKQLLWCVWNGVPYSMRCMNVAGWWRFLGVHVGYIRFVTSRYCWQYRGVFLRD